LDEATAAHIKVLEHAERMHPVRRSDPALGGKLEVARAAPRCYGLDMRIALHLRLAATYVAVSALALGIGGGGGGRSGGAPGGGQSAPRAGPAGALFWGRGRRKRAAPRA